MSNSSDNIYASGGARSIVPLNRTGERVSSGYTGSLTLGVERS